MNFWTPLLAPFAPAWHGTSHVHRLLSGHEQEPRPLPVGRPRKWKPWALLRPGSAPITQRQVAACWELLEVA